MIKEDEKETLTEKSLKRFLHSVSWSLGDNRIDVGSARYLIDHEKQRTNIRARNSLVEIKAKNYEITFEYEKAIIIKTSEDCVSIIDSSDCKIFLNIYGKENKEA